MPPFVAEYLSKVHGFWSDRTTSQRILMAGLSVAVVMSFALMIYWMNKPDYKVLMTNLYPEDASRIVAMLQADKEDYVLENNGQTIKVPAGRVYELRLKVAGEGNLHGQGVGFEIFDNVQIGQTDFVQHINYQRALQGELARTITEFPMVEKARVHLVIPQKSLFIEDQISPSASIVLQLKDNGKLGAEETQGIVNLVSMAVEGLEPKSITVTDMKGRPLYTPEDEASGMAMSNTQLEYKAEVEAKLQRRILELLGPAVGPEKVIARVNTDLDFSQRTVRKEVFDPDGSVVRSETRNEETTAGAASLAGGEPDANFRGDGFTGTRTTQDSTRESRTTNFEINKQEESIITPMGELKRLTVAVIVDGTWETNADGESVYVPRSAEDIERIRTLIANAVGFDEARGDTIEVSNISFGEPQLADADSLMRTMLEYAQRLGKPFLNGLLIFLFLILVVRPVIMALIRPRVAEQEIEEMAGLPGSERLALEEDDMDEEAMDASRRLENAKNHAIQLSDDNIDQAVHLLRTWLTQEA
ncbi:MULTISPECIES: flagellar basal-body MS-ring/collar protein FliF [unclassified Pseudodesulfovibrio]|uniref:flagellar basal-body MS-ring/collar protein FliF n=1 Tax=unclassified Pseudodesulfovibrio TaxID=2661612 RepID=UPI000FEBA264|nr:MULTISPECIES: flagellar basal-body MS-ring/collar protein FliF [unclassified Pseudodesulfovibrio]MCJ2165919.1 flagellar M-ring protein FliF [Pseudodesulfovibrio sp. S3-i]RWU02650.1 flagellar M-ring protein FliF [Pseudodesulfovibrio sp. S3]